MYIIQYIYCLSFLYHLHFFHSGSHYFMLNSHNFYISHSFWWSGPKRWAHAQGRSSCTGIAHALQRQRPQEQLHFFPGQAAAPLAPPTNAADAPGVPPAAKDGSATASGAAGGASTGGFLGVGRMVLWFLRSQDLGMPRVCTHFIPYHPFMDDFEGKNLMYENGWPFRSQGKSPNVKI